MLTSSNSPSALIILAQYKHVVGTVDLWRDLNIYETGAGKWELSLF